jgi:adenine-specific DNA-methyltransferase
LFEFGKFATGSPVELSSQLQAAFEIASSEAKRRERGQFFTPKEVSRFMASLLDIPRNIRLLDPGAGIGALSAAVCERVSNLPSSHNIDLHLFETDPVVIPLLRETMERCGSELRSRGHTFSYTLHENDFILDGAAAYFHSPTLFGTGKSIGQFDAVIMNPPYFKLSRNSEHARLLADVVHGQPNIYALFLAGAAALLRNSGQLVAITPRSFCNGLYFRGFRQWFLARMSLEHVHMVESRSDTFRDVLQENLITLWNKKRQKQLIGISVSFGKDMDHVQKRSVACDKLLHDADGDLILRIPANPDDGAIVRIVERWPRRFYETGLRVSTGPVVSFRAREFLLREITDSHFAPLISVHNVKPFRTEWTRRHNKHPVGVRVCEDSMRLLVPNRNYVLLRRFSAKEERRRLTASPLLKRDQLGQYVALENHINYIYHSERDLTDDETHGLVALFNSVLFDRYFRTLSGNTQVNATELRSMPFPTLEHVERLGANMRSCSDLSSTTVEEMVLCELGVPLSLRKRLLSATLFAAPNAN